MQRPNEPVRYAGVEQRVQFAALLIALGMAGLVVQFWNMQVVRMQEYRAKAEKNQVWQKTLPSDRGIIYGRGGVVLADNKPSSDVVFVPGECPEDQRVAVCDRLERFLGVSSAALQEQVKQHRRAPYTQLLVKQDINMSDRVRIEENAYALPGVLTVVRPQRRYRYGEVGGQLLGYMGMISKWELEQWQDAGYTQNDMVGKSGIERAYESSLRGYDGYAVVTKYAQGSPQLRTNRLGVPRIAPRDSHGHELEEIVGRRKDPVPGDPVYLTLDIELQAFCEQILRGQVGAVAVLEAETGAVLALASSPSGFDPGAFVSPARVQERLALLNAPEPNPMFNRAFREIYAPGSLFKVMMAVAALEEGIINGQTTFYCPGSFRIDGAGRAWRCHRRAGHGHVTVKEALAWSCDVYFYNVGLKLGIDRIAAWSDRMGLGRKTGLDLPGEMAGLIPTPAWKKALHAGKDAWEQKWYPGETVNVSIGQGSVATTPLQNAVMLACVVNGGNCVRPYLNEARGAQLTPLHLKPSTVDLVVAGMRMCMEDPKRGTGRRGHIPGMVMVGKTGTAQMVGLHHHGQYASEFDIPYELRDHAWFVCGVLDREPKISVCVLIEHGAHGSTAAAPVAREVIRYFYDRSAPRPAGDAPLAQVAEEE